MLNFIYTIYHIQLYHIDIDKNVKRRLFKKSYYIWFKKFG